MSNRLLVNGTGYTLTDTAPSGEYTSIKVNGRYLWGRTTRDSNSGGFYFIKGGTKYYACLNPISIPSGHVRVSSGQSWTVPDGVNRIKYNLYSDKYTSVKSGDVIKVKSTSGEHGSNTTVYLNSKMIDGTNTIRTLDIYYGPDINT